MIRVYIAADSHLQERARALCTNLEVYDIEITSRWLDVKLEAFHPVTEEALRKAAQDNFADIDRAMFFIAYNPLSHHKMGTGGRHVELGYALAERKYVIYVGEQPENVFHWHYSVIASVDPMGEQLSVLARQIAAVIMRIAGPRKSER